MSENRRLIATDETSSRHNSCNEHKNSEIRLTSLRIARDLSGDNDRLTQAECPIIAKCASSVHSRCFSSSRFEFSLFTLRPIETDHYTGAFVPLIPIHSEGFTEFSDFEDRID